MKRKLRGKQALTMLFMMAAGAAVGALLAMLGLEALPEGRPGVGGLVAAAVALPVLYMIVLAVHEAGHIGGGLLVDYRPLLFIVGPLRIERAPEGTRVGLNRSFTLGGGLAAMAPVGLHDLRRRTLVMIAGGPAASLMFGVQCLALLLALSSVLMAHDSGGVARGTAVALLFLGLGSLLIGLITLVPARSAGFYSDGARILRLWRRSEGTEQEVALLALTGLTLGGTRPCDWDAALVAKSAELRDGGAFEAGGQIFAYAHAADRGDIERARQHLERALAILEQLPFGSRSSVLLMAATFYALFDGDVERARACYRQATGRALISAPHQRVLADAAILHAAGDTAGAARAARAALQLSARAVDRGAAALDRALAERILVSAESAAR